MHLLEHHDLRAYYGDLIGEIAESHHWPAHRVAETFEHRPVNAPPFLAPANWRVDALKVAFLLRTADAAHIDSQRAPWFLFALRQPEGISQSHWLFQAKLGQPTRTERGELRLSSGSSFATNEQQAWWLAYETASMIDRELRAAESYMRDAARPTFAARAVEHIATPEAFATNVRTSGWEPVNVAPKIGNVAKVIANLGGAALYGDHPDVALRELIQNAADAVRALRALGGIDQHEGKIEVALSRDADSTWLHVTDTGIGMSRFVLTEVLLDFGNSLWSSDSLLSEIPGLASQEFNAVGRFGIGFYSVFMLGKRVKVTTRRYRRAADDASDQWLLEFDNGLGDRPTLRRPASSEELLRSGTKVSVMIDDRTLENVLFASGHDPFSDHPDLFYLDESDEDITEFARFTRVVASLCPTLDITVGARIDSTEVTVVKPNDWQTLESDELLLRLYPSTAAGVPLNCPLIDLREDSGLLVGRVGYVKGYFAHGITTHRGISSGSLSGFVGVTLAHNNSDLARNTSVPVASASAWKRCAKQWIDSTGHPDLEVLARIHPLIRDHDLPLYRLDGATLTKGQLTERLASYTELLVCGELDHDESSDDISADKFAEHLELRDGIVFIPIDTDELTESLGLAEINYVRRVESALKTAWRGFDRWKDEEAVIGEVNGIEIVREVMRYTRRAS
ncbi:ATP-binding protein [Steroidobacter flavus]|uniref:ATP-binding protein n=1 Tax=Steroidobacter flavus TaxID=1842136 RepID=A0ABV8SM90_9GAMM